MMMMSQDDEEAEGILQDVDYLLEVAAPSPSSMYRTELCQSSCPLAAQEIGERIFPVC